MPNKPAFFFASTQSVDDQLGDVFSFIWSCYAGLREMWWQVRGFHREFPTLHISDITNKFLSGLPLPGGIDLNQMFIQTDWEDHEAGFSKWLLFEACTFYENWLEKICSDIFPSSKAADRNAYRLQFPAGIDNRGNPTGYPVAVAEANNNSSPLMVAEFFPTVSNNRLNCWPNLNDYLVVYRYFKVCRNAYIHANGLGTHEVVGWHARLVAIQSQTPLPFAHRFNVPQPIVGSRIVLDLHDCILFATLVRRIICTLDAALCVSVASETILEDRLRTLIAQDHKWRNLPSDPARRQQRIHRILSASRIPEPVNLANVVTWMQAKRLI